MSRVLSEVDRLRRCVGSTELWSAMTRSCLTCRCSALHYGLKFAQAWVFFVFEETGVGVVYRNVVVEHSALPSVIGGNWKEKGEFWL